MKRLGISVYIDQAELDAVLAYIRKAHEHGFTRIFTCMISIEGDLWEAFKKVCAYAKSLGMEVMADVDPEVFKRYDLTYDDLGFFSELGLSGIRLDMGFSGQEEAMMSKNPYGLNIELNMSNGTKYVDNILSYNPDRSKIIGCHNFYPHRYTGLGRTHFLKCSEQFKAQGLRTAAFVSSATAKFGPWPVSEGLCTMEMHRELPIVTQAKDLFNTGLIDDVVIGNMFASDDELAALGALDRNTLELEVVFEDNVPDLERHIVLNEPHFNRGDVSEYLIRSTQSRVKYKGHNFECFNAKAIEPGDVLIESTLYTRYAGELQLALKNMRNSGKTNVVAKVAAHELYLIDEIKPWQTFKFVEKKE
ncbi:DUF871 domain-containing protein [Fusibacter sp. JL298sf-3]